MNRWRGFWHRLGLCWWEEYLAQAYGIKKFLHRKCRICGRVQHWIPDCGAPGGGGRWGDKYRRAV